MLFVVKSDRTPEIRGGTVQLFHGSVSVWFGKFMEKLYCQIKIKKIRII